MVGSGTEPPLAASQEQGSQELGRRLPEDGGSGRDACPGLGLVCSRRGRVPVDSAPDVQDPDSPRCHAGPL